MKKTPAFIAAFLAVATTGCVLNGAAKKPVTPAPVVAKPAPAPSPPPPPPLSTPQTQVDLPKPQFLDPAALAGDAVPTQVEAPEPTPPTRPAGGRRPTGTQSAPAAPPAAAPPNATPPATTTPPPEPTTPQTQIQEIVPPAEAKRLQELAQSRRRDVQAMLDQLGRRQLNTTQKSAITSINDFVAKSVDAERRGDVKLAESLAERAQVLAKDLINGK